MFHQDVPSHGTRRDPRNLLTVIPKCGAYYNAIVEQKPIGPLVVYAGMYGPDEDRKNYVGWEYFNFAKVEEKPWELVKFADEIVDLLRGAGGVDAVVAAPVGGLALGELVGFSGDLSYYYPEKHVLEVVEGGRNRTELRWDRHVLPRGLRVAILDDVINNTSTTRLMIELIEGRGSQVVALACALNRSERTEFQNGAEAIPILAAVHRVTDQFEQEDSRVAKKVGFPDVEWHPKDNWDQLLQTLENRYYEFFGVGADDRAMQRAVNKQPFYGL